MLPWDLEDWLTDEGAKVVEKAAAKTVAALNEREHLLYEFWLLDTEQRNGGLSQYFYNRGLARWQTLSALAAATMPSFAEFAAKVNDVVVGSGDRCQALVGSSVDIDAWYDSHQVRLVSELRAAMESRGD